MHIPDGFLSTPVAGSLWLVATGANAVALRQLQRELDEGELPTLGVLAAGVFAAQALNVPVLGGTSGHLVGTALLTALVGPQAAMVVMTAILTVQALVFQDGGLLALGANVANMAVVGSLVAHGALTAVRGLWRTRAGQAAAVFVAGWSATLAGAAATALELALSGTSPAHVVVPAMAVVHAAVGVLEGTLSVAAWRLLTAARPALAAPRDGVSPGILGLVIAGALAFLAPWASSDPDGLERVAADLGFHSFARPAWFTVFPDYRLPHVVPDPWNTALAVLLGAVLAYSLLRGLGRVLAARRTT